MNYLPTTNVKNWILEPKVEGWLPIYVSQSQAEAILKAWKNSPNAEIYNSVTGRLFEVVNRNDYRVRRLGDLKEDQDKESRRWICGYGERHPMNVWPSEKCGCREKYGMSEHQFIDHMQKAFGINHAHEVKDHMRETFLRNKTLV